MFIQKDPAMKCSTMAMMIGVLMLSGCSSPGDLLLHQEANLPPKVIKVEVAGDYGLFIAGESQPLLQFSLKQGDQIGFERDAEGMVTWLRAIAGTQRTRLEIDKSYEWRKL
jgi:hypothetical protein